MSKETVDELSELLNNTARQPRKRKKPYAVIAIVVLVIFSSPFVAQFIYNYVLDSRINDVISKLPDNCTITYDEAKHDMWKRKSFINDVTLTCDNIEILSFNKVELSSIVSGEPIPTNIIIRATGGKTDISMPIYQNAGALIAKFGYGEIDFDAYLSYNLGVVSKDLRIFNFIIEAQSLGTLGLEITIPTVNADTVRGVAKQILTNKPIRLWAGFKNTDFASSVVNYYASKHEISEDEAKAKLLDNLNTLITKENEYTVEQKNKLIQLYRFVSNPAEIVATTAIDSELSLLDIYTTLNYEGMAQLMLSVSTMPIDIVSK